MHSGLIAKVSGPEANPRLAVVASIRRADLNAPKCPSAGSEILIFAGYRKTTLSATQLMLAAALLHFTRDQMQEDMSNNSALENNRAPSQPSPLLKYNIPYVTLQIEPNNLVQTVLGCLRMAVLRLGEITRKAAMPSPARERRTPKLLRLSAGTWAA